MANIDQAKIGQSGGGKIPKNDPAKVAEGALREVVFKEAGLPSDLKLDQLGSSARGTAEGILAAFTQKTPSDSAIEEAIKHLKAAMERDLVASLKLGDLPSGPGVALPKGDLSKLITQNADNKINNTFTLGGPMASKDHAIGQAIRGAGLDPTKLTEDQVAILQQFIRSNRSGNVSGSERQELGLQLLTTNPKASKLVGMGNIKRPAGLSTAQNGAPIGEKAATSKETLSKVGTTTGNGTKANALNTRTQNLTGGGEASKALAAQLSSTAETLAGGDAKLAKQLEGDLNKILVTHDGSPRTMDKAIMQAVLGGSRDNPEAIEVMKQVAGVAPSRDLLHAAVCSAMEKKIGKPLTDEQAAAVNHLLTAREQAATKAEAKAFTAGVKNGSIKPAVISPDGGKVLPPQVAEIMEGLKKAHPSASPETLKAVQASIESSIQGDSTQTGLNAMAAIREKLGIGPDGALPPSLAALETFFQDNLLKRQQLKDADKNLEQDIKTYGLSPEVVAQRKAMNKQLADMVESREGMTSMAANMALSHLGRAGIDLESYKQKLMLGGAGPSGAPGAAGLMPQQPFPNLGQMMNPMQDIRATQRSMAVSMILNDPCLSVQDKVAYLMMMLTMFNDQDIIEKANELAQAQNMAANPQAFKNQQAQLGSQFQALQEVATAAQSRLGALQGGKDGAYRAAFNAHMAKHGGPELPQGQKLDDFKKAAGPEHEATIKAAHEAANKAVDQHFKHGEALGMAHMHELTPAFREAFNEEMKKAGGKQLGEGQSMADFVKGLDAKSLKAAEAAAQKGFGVEVAGLQQTLGEAGPQLQAMGQQLQQMESVSQNGQSSVEIKSMELDRLTQRRNDIMNIWKKMDDTFDQIMMKIWR